ncbi:MAG: GDP-mannose 4,6-dehydratase [Clostridiaceae bacterium]|nr:GDP-mannose 4,6-dehydratase [Clostridiaceae bacterium]
MKVLITGGYGFIGSHVAERFEKEGYQVFIIDNMLSGKAENVECKHKHYRFDVEDKRCEDIFRNNNFDVVLHLAAQINASKSLKNPYVDTKTNILGLVNMLELSSKYKVKRFIFASSAEVYGNNENLPLKEDEECNPVSPYGISKYVGEQYCKKWSEIYNLDTVCFRFSNVYGPRQGLFAEGGVISIYMEKLMNNNEIKLYGDGKQTRDFIYVSDLVEAVYRAAESDISGIYNLSTNTRRSLNDLIEILKGYHKVKGIIRRDDKKGDIKHSCLDNSKVKNALDWVPTNSFEDGIEKTFKWYKDNYENQEIMIKKKDSKKDWKHLKKVLPYIENVILFLVIFSLTKLFKMDFSLNTVDLKLVYIVIMGLVYGTNQSIIAVILSVCLFTYESFSTGMDSFSMMLDTSFVLKISIYLLVGLIVGYMIDKYSRQGDSNKVFISAIEEKYNFLQEVYNETYISKSLLENQVVNSEDSFGKIYGIIKELDSLEPQFIYKGAIDVLERILNTDEISIYSIDKSAKFLRLIVKSNKESLIAKKTIELDYFMEAKEQLLQGNIFINKKLNPELPMLIAPIVDTNKKTIALIMLHGVEFDRLTLYFQNLFVVVSRLINTAVLNAYLYESAINDERYVQDTIFLKKEFFENILSIKTKSMKESKSEFAMLKIENSNRDYKSLSEVVMRCIREADFAGIWTDDNIYLILSNASNSDALIVSNRLKDQGVEFSQIIEEVLYV